MKDFTKVYQLKGLKPKNKGHTNFYECCDLTKKVYLNYTFNYRQREVSDKDGNETEEPGTPANVPRNFRYMRRRPTIISYKPPEGDEGNNENNELSDVVVSCDRKTSDHMILDRINAEPSSIEMVQVEDSEDDLAKLNKPLLVYIDGPFGAPTSQIFRAQHAVLIGTGIGVTPFASILQSIMHRYWQARNTCPKCQYQWTSDLSASVGLNLRKVL